MAKITEREAKKILSDNNIGIVADGIGNCDIHYLLDDGYGKQQVTIGGYCDMEPFKWSVCTKWTVGDNKYGGQPWDIVYTDEVYVEHCGGEYDVKLKGYFWDKEYIDMLLEAKEKLLKLLPKFREKTDVLHEKFLDTQYAFTVKQPAGTDMWQGTLLFHGKMYWTKSFERFLDAKKATDDLLEEQLRETGGK